MIKNDKNSTNTSLKDLQHSEITLSINYQNWLQIFTVISCLLSLNSICINAINYYKCKTALKIKSLGLLHNVDVIVSELTCVKHALWVFRWVIRHETCWLYSSVWEELMHINKQRCHMTAVETHFLFSLNQLPFPVR